MKDRLSVVFGVVTVAVLLASAAFGIRTMVMYRESGLERGKKVYSEFSQEWNRRFSVDSLQELEKQHQTDQFLTWFASFIEQHPLVEEITVMRNNDSRLFHWDSGSGYSEVSQVEFTDRQVRFGERILPLHMRYRVISHSRYFALFRGIGFITAGYAAFLLILFPVSLLGSRRRPRPGQSVGRTHGDSEDKLDPEVELPPESDNDLLPEVDPAPETDAVYEADAVPDVDGGTTADEYIPPTATWDIHTRLRTELDLASQQEKDLCLVLIQLFDREDIEPIDWLQQRFIYQDLLFAREEQHYAVIIPDADIHSGLREARAAVSHWPEVAYAGVTSRGGRLMDSERLMQEAYTALNRARENREKVVGFQPDPEKYRQFIARSLDPHLEG